MRVAYVRHDPFGSLLAGVLRPAALHAAFMPGQSSGEVPAIPAPVDVVDNGDRFTLKVDLPGVSKEDINLSVDGARVALSATARATADNNGTAQRNTVLRSERRGTKYARTLQLPAEVDANAAEASFENGVLTVALPKRVTVRQISVR